MARVLDLEHMGHGSTAIYSICSPRQGPRSRPSSPVNSLPRFQLLGFETPHTLTSPAHSQCAPHLLPCSSGASAPSPRQPSPRSAHMMTTRSSSPTPAPRWAPSRPTRTVSPRYNLILQTPILTKLQQRSMSLSRTATRPRSASSTSPTPSASSL